MSTFFEVAYEGTPPWDLGRPQRVVTQLEGDGRIVGSVLDVGCGTGEHALYLAERGHEVLGVDLAERAIERARGKTHTRGIAAEFRIWDALRVGELGRTFDTAIDIGMFHTLADEERPVYAESLRSALVSGGRCFLLCWSERNPWGFGPRRVSQADILGTFERGWSVGRIEEAALETRLDVGEVHAWLARLTRT